MSSSLAYSAMIPCEYIGHSEVTPEQKREADEALEKILEMFREHDAKAKSENVKAVHA